MMQVALMSVLFLFCLGVIYGAICDLTSFIIPNRVSYGLASLFILYAALGWSALPLAIHLLLALVVFGLCLIFWKLRWLGGGDVKFLGAISLWMGPDGMLPFLILLSALSALFITVLRFARERNDLIQASGWPGFVKLIVSKAEANAIPYGFPAALAALTVMVGKISA